MGVDIIMPQLGETVAEGKIVNWFKKVGDPIKAGENLFEVETDKVTVEVPVTTGGIVSDIRFGAGDVAKVGQVVAVIGAEGTAPPPPSSLASGAGIAASTVAPPAAATHQTPSLLAAATNGREPIQPNPWKEVRTPERNYGPATLPGGAKITPLARRLAHDAGIDLAALRGSGPHNRITARDIERAKAPTLLPASTAVAPVTGSGAEQVKALYRDIPFEEVPVDNMRRVIASRLVQAKQTVPHFYVAMDVDLDRLLALREDVNAAAPRDRDGNATIKVSVNDFIIKGLALALQRVPAANAVWAEDRILRFAQSDVAVAVAIEGGLITPVIRRAEQKSLSAISAEMKDLAVRARQRKLKPDEYQGGATSVSNLGMYGVRDFAAIINPPHATILAVGAAQRRPIEAPDGSVKFTSLMTATLSCDHRAVDGALGAELLGAFKALLENPLLLMI